MQSSKQKLNTNKTLKENKRRAVRALANTTKVTPLRCHTQNDWVCFALPATAVHFSVSSWHSSCRCPFLILLFFSYRVRVVLYCVASGDERKYAFFYEILFRA